MRYTYILLDSDNTLMDFDAAEDYAIVKTLTEFDCPCTEQEKKAYSEINSALWEQFNQGLVTREFLMVDRFRRFFEKMNFPEADYVEVNERYKKNLGSCAKLIDGALEFCQEMSREAELYILTNGALQVQNDRFNASPLKQYVRDIFISELTGYQKPQKEYFDYVFAHIPDFEIEKAIMIGDSLSSDIAGANHAGVKACWYNPAGKECGAGTNGSGVHCDYIVKDYEEMKRVIRGEMV